MHSESMFANKYMHMQKYLINLHAWPGQDFWNQCHIWNQGVKNIAFKYRLLTSWCTVIFHCTIWLNDSQRTPYANMKPVHAVCWLRVNIKCPIYIYIKSMGGGALWLFMICLNHPNMKIHHVKTRPMFEYQLTFSENTFKASILHFTIIEV